MRRGLLVAPGAVPSVIELDDSDSPRCFQLALGTDQVCTFELPTPRQYRKTLVLFYAGAPHELLPVNTTATAMAGPGFDGIVRGPALVMVSRKDAISDLALTDMLTLATAVVTAELGLPAPK